MLSALFAKFTGRMIGMGINSSTVGLLRDKLSDPVEGQPLLTEEALVHAKSDYGSGYDPICVVHFYIAARDTVVNCEVSRELWQSLEMKSRGQLTHQGGAFHSFQTNGEIFYDKR